MWQFPGIRKRAIEELSKHLKAEDKLRLGREYKVLHWVKEGFNSILSRGHSITEEEKNNLASKLGWETTARILYLRLSNAPPSARKCSDCKQGTLIRQCRNCTQPIEPFGCYRCNFCRRPAEATSSDWEDRVRKEFAADFEFLDAN
jgi:hypothetical protein